MPINARMRSRWSRPVDVLLAVVAVACLVLALVRFADNISFSAPLQLVTSGAEEEALFSIWSVVHGQPVYTDPLAIPYTASYFNWLFYAIYGSLGSAALHLFHLDDAWLPTICRVLTSLLAVAGAIAFSLVLRWSGRTTEISLPTLFSFAIIALFNPLCGLWLVTARPDLGAAMFGLAGLALFFRYLRAGGLGWIALTALALFAAWSFKQTSVSALAGIGLTLLVLQRWRGVVMLCGIWSAGVILALASLGPDYRHGLYLSQVHAGFHVTWAWQHFLTALTKMPFILLALVAIPLTSWRRKRGGPPDPFELTAMLTVIAALVLELPSSGKGGAADYYFIPLGIWSMVWLALAADRMPPGWRNPALIATACLMILGIGGVFFGWRGTLDCRDPRDPFQHLARYLATRPGPVYVQTTYGDLPWISPTTPHFVIAYNYKPDRGAGVKFERGGWQTLLQNGYFSTVVADASSDELDGMLTGRYRFVREEAGLRYFERK